MRKAWAVVGVGVLLMTISNMRKPRGIRNNNPGNLEKNGIDWNGLALEQSDPRFYQFVSPEYGIRALARTLMTYYNRYGINTVEGIINRWAPPHENNTESYIEHVASLLGVQADEPFVVTENLPVLAEAIIIHENGENPYTSETLLEGIELAYS